MATDTEALDLLSTAAVAELLGCSRQHVVNMCERGELPCVKIGQSHRRIRRRDVEELVGGHRSREYERSLWLHRAVMARVVANPEGTLSRARKNIDHMLQVHAGTMGAAWVHDWADLLDQGVDAVLDVLGSRSQRAIELRQNSPFAGVLPERDRKAVLAAFTRHWHSEHTQQGTRP